MPQRKMHDDAIRGHEAMPGRTQQQSRSEGNGMTVGPVKLVCEKAISLSLSVYAHYMLPALARRSG